MMSKRYTILSATLLVACAYSVASAQVIIGDFETGLDGWEAQGDSAGPGPGPTVSALAQNANVEISGLGGIYKNGVQDATGQVLRILPGLANFWAITLNQADVPTLAADIGANRLLKANVTFRATPFLNGDGDFGQWPKLALNGQGTGWQESPDPAGPGGTTAWSRGLGSATYEITWNLSALNITDTSVGANAQLILSVNYDRGFYTNSGAVNGPAFYIDNIRLVPIPEPSTVALLGLGALGLVARRRRS